MKIQNPGHIRTMPGPRKQQRAVHDQMVQLFSSLRVRSVATCASRSCTEYQILHFLLSLCCTSAGSRTVGFPKVPPLSDWITKVAKRSIGCDVRFWAM